MEKILQNSNDKKIIAPQDGLRDVLTFYPRDQKQESENESNIIGENSSEKKTFWRNERSYSLF